MRTTEKGVGERVREVNPDAMGEEGARILSHRAAAIEMAHRVLTSLTEIAGVRVRGGRRGPGLDVHIGLRATDVKGKRVEEEAKVEVPSERGHHGTDRGGVSEEVGDLRVRGGRDKSRDFPLERGRGVLEAGNAVASGREDEVIIEKAAAGRGVRDGGEIRERDGEVERAGRVVVKKSEGGVGRMVGRIERGVEEVIVGHLVVITHDWERVVVAVFHGETPR